MNNLFDNLLLSSPNGGGLFFIYEGNVFKLDNFDTTGLDVMGRKVLRGIQPAVLQLYDNGLLEVANSTVLFDDIHDVYLDDQFIYLVGTSNNEIIKLNSKGEELQRWVFPGENDALHINCLTRWNGRIVFSAFGEFSEYRGYKGKTEKVGFVQDLLTGERLITGLSQPHSLVPVGENLLLANSELEELSEYGPSGELVRTLALEGYTRGICIANHTIYIGLSSSRNIEHSKVSTATVVALDRESWQVRGRIQLPVTEIYAIQSITNRNDVIHVLANIASNTSFRLASAVVESDRQIENLSQTTAKSDRQIENLKQTVAERVRQIDNLNQDVADLNLQITIFNQALADRDKQIASLTEVMLVRDRELGHLNNASIERDSALATIDAMRRSHSWLITAPLRRLTDRLRKNLEPKPKCNLFSRAVMVVCLLPATFFHYGDYRRWARAAVGGKSFFGSVLNKPDMGRERLVMMPMFVRLPVSMLLALALRIRKNGGVLPSMWSLHRIIRSEGLRGVLGRLKERVPYGEVTSLIPQEKTRILVMDYRIPMKDISAGERATVGILKDLCAFGFDVVFLPNNMVPSPGYEEELQSFGVTVISSAQGYHSSNHYLSKKGYTFAIFYLIRVDVVETVLDVVRKVAPRARVIFHEPDVYFLREGREAELKNNPVLRAKAKATRDRELGVIRQVDHTIIVSPAELPVLRQFLSDSPVSVFPVLYAPVNSNPAPFKARKDIFFLGGFVHTPNVDAVTWFITKIWPLVHAKLPDVVFHIVGSEAPQAVLDMGSIPGVVVDGFLKDLDPLLSSMRMGVAPLRYGAGIKGKVAMTMGAGVPCVCTSIAAEGMGVLENVHARVIDDPNEFADAIVRLYNDYDQWTRLSINGRELVKRNFGAAANRSMLLRVLNEAHALPIQLFIDYCRVITPNPLPCPVEGEQVDVTIIIPVYNQWNYTRACLNSILETCNGNDIRYEIILADDRSNDETTQANKYYPGLRVIKTQNNVGFLRNCNNAAKYARGKYILLLNNDTIVLPGWMSSLYLILEEDESAAIVGSKLLYPDETIQEAGGLLLRNGTGYNAGRGSNRSEPVFNIIREADYISGASILIRKSFWDDVGGFDERYKNAYCEDSDLAMTARSKGLRVLYQPASEVIHFEHQSYADQAPSHDTTLQRHNINILISKWRDIFESDHLADVPWHLAMSNAERTPPINSLDRRRNGNLNILYISPFPSHPSNHGNRATIQQFARLFQVFGYKVHFVLLNGSDYSEDSLEVMRNCWDTLEVIPYSNPMLADASAIPYDGWYEEGLGERIRCLCAKYDIDVVFLSYVFQSKILEYVPAYMLKVIDTHDKMGNRYEMLRANGQSLEFFSCTPEEEGAYLRRADIVVARREEEARYFDVVTGHSTAIVIPHVEEPQFVEKEFLGLHNVGIVASANRINLVIVRECLEAIDRELSGRTCSFVVHVVGQVKDMLAALSMREAEVFRKPWVRMHGFVDDIAKFYNDMDLIISPVTMGTGINVKTVQAMAFGMPLLTTACGSKGIETGDPMHSHESADALVDSLFSLVDNLGELERLAEMSRTRYATFYRESLESMQDMFLHHKLDKRSAVSEYRRLKAKIG